MKSAAASESSLARRAPVRVVTAAALFDGHDAAINLIRRLLQTAGAEVIHLGHDRSVEEIASTAVQEDADAVCVSSYQGGHVDFFRFLVDRLRASGAEQVRVYGGGGGVIAPAEVRELERCGVARIFRPEDGQALGLDGMVRQILEESAGRADASPESEVERLSVETPAAVGRLISWFENSVDPAAAVPVRIRSRLEARRRGPPAPVLGFTGTGGAGKSSLVDEIVRRFRREFPARSVGILSIDPSRRRSGGALLGDRLRMNAIYGTGVFMRSLATRRAHLALSRAVSDAIAVLQGSGYDLVIVETAGIGQSDSEIVDLGDVSVYVMTPEFGAPSQLEKIDMLDLADLVVLNKYDRPGGPDALRAVSRQWRREHSAEERTPETVPVFATIASRFADPGTDRLFQALLARIGELGFAEYPRRVLPPVESPRPAPLVPEARARYLGEIAEQVRAYHRRNAEQSEIARDAYALGRALRALGDEVPARLTPYESDAGRAAAQTETVAELRRRYDLALARLESGTRESLAGWPESRDRYAAEAQSYRVRDREIDVENRTRTQSGLALPRVALPAAEEWGELVRYLGREGPPGAFPFTGGVFPFARREEDPTRMFAGEGTPERTNRRFHLLSRGQPAVRLSTAFDSVTLYGRDPHQRPDIWGKVGTSGVSVCTVDDAKKLYSGFDLCDPATSVSMTINGPAPVVLAFFLNAAIDQRVERHLRETGELERARNAIRARQFPEYAGALPEGHDGTGLALLGVAGDELIAPEVYERIRAEVLRSVRGTLQADILKEDQAQNTCIFSTEFALRMMRDVQRFFVDHDVRNFYSVSISGYHIAEAGANPISQLAFTLANGLTYCEYYLAQGMAVDEFAPNFSFFFSNGLDPEYSVIGRVARRIWAIAMRDRYGASERSQKLKYHIQTSGRSLHTREMAFNDIRTTIQALTALEDGCNSLHTNAYDEAVTTPTEASVRRALAIQLILGREFGQLRSENSLQGSYAIEALTDQVEEAVLEEFERLSERGGVLGAMETMYQRGRIQDESLLYEQRKHSGEIPVIGVNTFENPDPDEAPVGQELIRATDAEKRSQLENLERFQARNADAAGPALQRLQEVAIAGGNLLAELLETTRRASLGQITEALFEVGGRYRRAM